jgi:hypothetical protein
MRSTVEDIDSEFMTCYEKPMIRHVCRDRVHAIGYFTCSMHVLCWYVMATNVNMAHCETYDTGSELFAEANR